MKKTVAIILSAIICLAGMLPASAFSCDGGSVPQIVNTVEKFATTFVCIFEGMINKFTGRDESNITKASVQETSYEEYSPDYIIENPETTLSAQTWVMNEITLTSTAFYGDPFSDINLDLVLTGNGRRYTVPGFWDGGNTWKVRFVCPSAGTWYYYTVCTNAEDTGLNGRTGKVECTAYTGDYDIYKHGFVTTAYGEKYFTYADGTPFAYLGDTHWSLGDETEEMVEIIAEKRASQGYTVIQSEPIGATFDFTDGITDADISGLQSYDRKFISIAENGLTHANAEFFFPSYIDGLIANFGGYSDKIIADGQHDLSDGVKIYLEKISRYWVARYGAFPVIWTLGQETDGDFYSADDNHPEWNYINNPYKLIAEYIGRYDCYDHPLTAHQENAGCTTAKGEDADILNRYTDTRASTFNDVEEHNCFAVQWSPSKTEQNDFSIPKEYWYNSDGKVAINYEGQYCYLWTKNYGARMQGWCAFLNGLYGYGWGGHDTWSYLNIYDEENDSSDGVDTITSAEKKNATWQDALEYESSYQCGYMKNYLCTFDWYNLIPRFDNKAYFTPCADVYYCIATNKDNSEGVVYFYSFTDTSLAENINTKMYGGVLTGTIGNLEPNTEYKCEWFNPVTGETSETQIFKTSSLGTHYIGARQWNGEEVNCDMVFRYYK